jgi:hypothetical protein
MLNTSDRQRSRPPQPSQRNTTRDVTSASSVDDHGANRGHGRCSDPAARARACEFLHTLAGTQPAELSWDDTFCLQGHAHVGGRELIVIAPRDDQHQTVVLTVEDWDHLHYEGGNSATLIAEHAIASPQHLESVLARQFT